MTRDPREGLDAAGYMTTGSDPSRIPDAYRSVLATCAQTLTDELRDSLHGLYLYGSVANGQAAIPRSDLDLYAVVATRAAADLCGTIAHRLTQTHRGTVRDVGIARYTIDQVRAENDSGRAERCFLKHYCLSVTGIDLRPGFPRCRPNAAIAREFIGNLEATRPRGLLRAAAVLFSFVDGGWSTAVETGADQIALRKPEYAGIARQFLAGSPLASESEKELRGWLIQQVNDSLG